MGQVISMEEYLKTGKVPKANPKIYGALVHPDNKRGYLIVQRPDGVMDLWALKASPSEFVQMFLEGTGVEPVVVFTSELSCIEMVEESDE